MRELKSVNASWWLGRWAELYSGKPALFFEDRVITYGRLNERVDQVCCWLQSVGIEKGDRVAVLLKNCPEFIELYLACARLGAIFVPLNFRLAAEELHYLISHCRPRVLVHSHDFAGAISRLDIAKYRPPLEVARVSRSGEEVGGQDYAALVAAFEGREPFLPPSLAPGDPEEPQVIMYTSGTTGRPKGAVLSYRKTFFNCLNADIFFNLSFQDRMLVVLPMFHSGGLFIQVSPCLYKGATLVLHEHFNGEQAYMDIERYKVTKFLGVPTVYRALFKVDAGARGDLSSLQVCAIGGEHVTPDVIRQCWDNGFPVREVMGQTETSILLWATEAELLERPGTVGRPVFHAEVTLIDRHGSPVGPGEVGEIVVRGSVLMKEYWQDPVQTEGVLGGGWLRTGDLARRDEDGYFYLVDRAKDMYISGGENVYPAEVERVLRDHAEVVDAAVVGVPDEQWGEVGHAFIIARSDSSLTPEDVLTCCRARLAGYKVPRTVTFCDEFPRTALGKVRKYLLKDQSTGEPHAESDELLTGHETW